MLLFMVVSCFIMIIDCIIADKIEKMLCMRDKKKEEKKDIESVLDGDTINILRNYGLISKEM